MKKTLILILFFIPIILLAQDEVVIINITDGQVIFEWNTINDFADGSTIDGTIYRVVAELSYRVQGNADTSWIVMAEIQQPDTSYDATAELKAWGVGTYDFAIRPFVRSGGQESVGNYLTSMQMGFSGMKGILAPSNYTVFRIIIKSQD